MPDILQRALVLLIGLVGSAVLAVNFNAAQAQQPRGYSVQLGDLMNESMQVHHTKLWLAGHAGNWSLAAYEVAKLKETIEEVKEAIVEIQSTSAEWRRLPVGELLANLESHLNNLADAVKAKDSAKFEAAYRATTSACNACHARAEQSQIKIMVPHPATSSTFVDQDFAPAGGLQKQGK
jgi:hypothetical protein